MVTNTPYQYLILILPFLLFSSCGDRIKTVKVSKQDQEDESIKLALWQYKDEGELPEGWVVKESNEVELIQRITSSESTHPYLVYTSNNNGEALKTSWQYKDLHVKMQFALGTGSRIAVQIYDDYELLLSHDNPETVSGTLMRMDSIVHTPYNRNHRKSVVWQSFSIDAQVDTGKNILQINEIYLNQNLIHHDLSLPLNTENGTEWHLSWIPLGGPLVIRNVEYLTPELQEQQQNMAPVFIDNLSYAYYEGEGWEKLPDFSQLNVIESGDTELFNINNLRQRNQFYGIVFTGNLKMSADAELKIWLASDDGSKLWINDSLLIDHDGTHGAEEKLGQIQLEKGSYPFELQYFQGSGGSALQLFYQINDQERKPLHNVVEERTRFDPDPAYILTAEYEPFLQRGFVGYPQYLGQASDNKFTHTISVGNPSGVHYNYDMASGSLLQIWRGDFINVQTMWHNRGPDQTAVPLAEVINPSFSTNWQLLSGKRKPWPDTLANPSHFKFQFYELNEKGAPSFHYQWKDANVVDAVNPTENGLQRTIEISNPPANLWFAISRGKDIIPIEKNLYSVADPGYFLKIKEIKGMNTLLRDNGNQKELLASSGFFDVEASVTYEIIF